MKKTLLVNLQSYVHSNDTVLYLKSKVWNDAVISSRQQRFLAVNIATSPSEQFYFFGFFTETVDLSCLFWLLFTQWVGGVGYNGTEQEMLWKETDALTREGRRR